MKDQRENKKFAKAYLVFKKSQGSDIPSDVSEQTKLYILDRLNPPVPLVFQKLLLIHGFLGLISLAICHQLGMNPFGTRFSIHNLVMDIVGHLGCTIFCGFWFIGGSVGASYFFLSGEEVRTLKRREWLQNFSLSLLSLAFFALLGAKIFTFESLLWLAGALCGGIFATRIMNYRYAE